MSQIFTRGHIDRTERRLIFERVQDVEPILERNKMLRGQTQDRKSSFRHVASIPNVIIEKWLNEEGARGHIVRLFGPEFDAMVAKKLRDPDYAFLRVDK